MRAARLIAQRMLTALAVGLAVIGIAPAFAQSVTVPPAEISPASDLDSNLVVFDFAWPQQRVGLPASAFATATPPEGPVPLAHFTPAGPNLEPGADLKGVLHLKPVAFHITAYGRSVEPTIAVPEISLPIVTSGDRILPVPDPESVVIDRRRRYTLLFGVGRVWTEPGDGGRSRALMPVSLIDSHVNSVRNGLVSFLYGQDQTVSNLVIQFSQETAPDRQADLWAQVAATFTPRAIPGAATRIKVFEHRQATAPAYRNWAALERKAGDAMLAGFDGPVGRAGNVVVSGLIDGDVTYLRGCRTRHGTYPFCRQMRHAVQTMSTTLYGLVAVAHLVEQFGIKLLTMTVGDLVPELQDHPQWRRVTIRNLLDMATGLGETAPVRAPGYIQADSDALAVALRAAGTTAEKLAIARQFPAYPWAPGKVFRFRTADSFVLSLALDRYVKTVLGQQSSLRWVLQERLFSALGIPRMQMHMTVGNNPAQRVPDIGSGLFPSTGEIVRLALLLRQSQSSLRRTAISSELIGEALSPDVQAGLPSGLNFPAGQGRYALSLWRTPIQIGESCRLFIPSAYGRGGSVISLMPNRLTAFRIANGDPADTETRNSSDLRRVGNGLRPFCKS